MRLHLVTIVLDGMPWLAALAAQVNRIQSLDWVWHISHGVAKPLGCTSWCKPIKPRLSKDGTTEFLSGLPCGQIRLYEKPEWNGKLEMVNAGMELVEQGDVVIEIDSDELWTARQIELIAHMLNWDRERDNMRFYCRYFVGPRLVTQGVNCYGNKLEYEWNRAWRATGKEFRFTRHEPPEVNQPENSILHAETHQLGLVCDHYAYATEAQVRLKEKYYGYANAVEQWRRLQANKQWPVRLGDYLKWVKDDAMVIPL